MVRDLPDTRLRQGNLAQDEGLGLMQFSIADGFILHGLEIAQYECPRLGYLGWIAGIVDREDAAGLADIEG